MNSHFLTMLTAAAVLTACNTGSGKADDTSTKVDTTGDDGGEDGGDGGGDGGDGGDGTDCYTGSADGSVAAATFPAAGLTGEITEEACVLTNGDDAVCLRIPLQGSPSNYSVGPFCPRTTDDTADDVGIWMEGGTAYDVDGSFIVGLAEFYGDDTWQLYDAATGEVRVTDTQESCEAAARPDVDPEYQNYCVECSIDYVGGGVETVLLVPKVPVAASTPNELLNITEIGASLSGVAFAPPAPVDAILGAHTIAPFDDCGGHVNTVVGYHLHTPVECGTIPASCDDHAPLMGVALDGYAIFAGTTDGGTEPGDLDACRGHEDTVRGYHYHAAATGENLFIGCFHGETVAGDGGGDDGGGGDGGPGDTPVDCEDVPDGSPCCGDDICDGPETEANCPADCG